MNQWCRATDHVIVAAVVSLLLFDVAAAILGGTEATISARLQYHGVRFPVIPFAIGFVAAHGVWPVFGVRN